MFVLNLHVHIAKKTFIRWQRPNIREAIFSNGNSDAMCST